MVVIVAAAFLALGCLTSIFAELVGRSAAALIVGLPLLSGVRVSRDAPLVFPAGDHAAAAEPGTNVALTIAEARARSSFRAS